MCEPNGDFIEDFLEEYKKYECLWNPYHAGFDDCFARTEALTKIVKALDVDISVQDCLRLLRSIREEYAQEQTKVLLNRRGSLGEKCRPRWMRIIDEMLEKVVSDEQYAASCTQNLSSFTCKRSPNLKLLFRHTIPSRKRKSAAKFKAEVKNRERQRESELRIKTLCRQTICSNNKNKSSPFVNFSGDYKKRKRVARNRKNRNLCSELSCGTLRIGSSNNVQRTMDRDCCKNLSDARDCSRPQTAWARQRDDYLDNLTWTGGGCERVPDCANHGSHSNRLSRVQNLCKDPCALPATHTCPNQSNQHGQCGQRTWEGRKRNLDIQPTIPDSRSCRSTAARPRSKSRSPCSAADRKRSKERPSCDKPCSPSSPPVCCPCPDSFKQSSTNQCEKPCPPKAVVTTCPATSKPECRPAQQPQQATCRKDSCPNYAGLKTTGKRCSETVTLCGPRESSRSRPIEACTRDTCPNLTRPNDARCATGALESTTTNPRTTSSSVSAHQRRSPGPNCSSVSQHQQQSTSACCPPAASDACGQGASSRRLRFESRPRLAASFENGVLEAYSQFKLVFPASSSATEEAGGGGRSSAALQTEPTTRSCGVGINSADLAPRRSSPGARATTSSCDRRSTRPGRSRQRERGNERVGTDRSHLCPDECDQANKCELEEADENLHDYVLLTPGGKYIPLVKTKADQCNEKVSFADCCADDQEEQVPDACENEMPPYCDDKSQRPAADQKCDSTTTKLLLQCIENVLKLEEKDVKDKCVEPKEDPVGPCKCKPPQDEQCEKIANCLACLQEKLKSAASSSTACPRGKLTQDLLEILKCVLEMDNGNKDECDEEQQKRECCKCDDAPRQPKCSENENFCKIETKQESCPNQTFRREVNENCNKAERASASARARSTCDKSVSCQDILARCAVISCPSRPSSRSKAENECQNVSQVRDSSVSPDRVRNVSRFEACSSEDRNFDRGRPSSSKTHQIVHSKESKECIHQSTGGASKSGPYQMTHGVDVIVPDAGRRERIAQLSKGVQVDDRSRHGKRRESSVGTQKRDTVLEYLVRCATRSTHGSAIHQPGPSSCGRSTNPSRSPGRVFATAVPRNSIQCCEQDLDFDDCPYRSFDAEITWCSGR